MHSNASQILSGQGLSIPLHELERTGSTPVLFLCSLHRVSLIVNGSLIAATPLAADVEVSRRGDGHHGHYAGLDRVADDEVGSIRDATGHVQREHDDAFVTDL